MPLRGVSSESWLEPFIAYWLTSSGPGMRAARPLPGSATSMLPRAEAADEVVKERDCAMKGVREVVLLFDASGDCGGKAFEGSAIGGARAQERGQPWQSRPR